MNIIGYKSQPLSDSKQEYEFAFVGFADILGFAKIVKQPSQRSRLVQAYTAIREELQKRQHTQFPIQIGMLSGFGNPAGQPWHQIIGIDCSTIFMISDSIFFILIPDRKGAEILFRHGLASIELMSRILSICWRFGLPARGALSDGGALF